MSKLPTRVYLLKLFNIDALISSAFTCRQGGSHTKDSQEMFMVLLPPDSDLGAVWPQVQIQAAEGMCSQGQGHSSYLIIPLPHLLLLPLTWLRSIMKVERPREMDSQL